MKKDLNNLKIFNEWVRETFTWVDNDVKGFMRRAWCARGKMERKTNHKFRQKFKIN